MKLLIRCGTAAFWTLLVVLALGCDKKEKPTQPTPPAADPSLQTLWPNEDGRTWNFRTTARVWADTGARYYQNPDSVPPVPPLSQLAALLGTQPIGANPVSDTATVQLKFEGQITTASGVTAQHLKATVLRPGALATLTSGGGTSFRRHHVPGGPGGFLRDLARARPDLARKLALFEERALATGGDTLVYGPTLFLSGNAWRRTSEKIGFYNDLDTALAWTCLTKNLAPGSEFTHQLIPSLASDVFLHGRILNRQTVQTPAGTFTNAVVCLYAVDYGISCGTDENGNPTGCFRFYDYGTVAYADNIGPVGSYERLLVGAGNPSLGYGDIRMVLSSRSAPGGGVPRALAMRSGPR